MEPSNQQPQMAQFFDFGSASMPEASHTLPEAMAVDTFEAHQPGQCSIHPDTPG